MPHSLSTSLISFLPSKTHTMMVPLVQVHLGLFRWFTILKLSVVCVGVHSDAGE